MAQVNYTNGSAGSIATNVFVTADVNNPKAVNQASGSGIFIVGVSQDYSKYAPLPGQSPVAADTLGDPIMVWSGWGDTCLINATSAGFTAGDRLTSNGSGFAVTATSNQYCGGIALETATGVGLYQMQIIFGPQS